MGSLVDFAEEKQGEGENEMITYRLSYTVFTGIKQGGHGVYANGRTEQVTFDAPDDIEASIIGSDKWRNILYEWKQPNAAVHFVGLYREVAWKPEPAQVRF